MKQLYFFLAAAFCVVAMSAAVTAATRTSVQSGAWSSASTWDTGVPTTGDSVIIANTHTVNLTANASIGTGAGATATVQSGGVLDLSIFLLTANTLTINNGGEVRQGGTGTSPSGTITTRSYAANSTYTFNGTQVGLTGAHPTYGNLIFAPTPASSGTFGLNLSVAGNLTINLGATQEIRFSTGTTGRTHSINGDLNIQSGIVVGSNGSSAAGSSTITIGGKLDITGGTFRGTNDVGDATFNIGGNVVNGGIWQQDDGSSSGIFSINLNGATSQDISGTNAISFENLTINNSNGITLSRNVDITRTLTLTSGDLDTGANTLTMPATATSAGTTDVVGNVLRTGFVSGGSALTFGNPFNTIAVTSGTAPANILVNLVKGSPADFANAVRRTYTILPSASGFTGTLQLHYNDSELNGNSEASLVLWRNDAGIWNNQGGTVTDDTVLDNNFVQLTGVTQFSPWTIAGPSAPTAVKLTKFNAASYSDGVQLHWESGFEVNNLGYHLYREQQGKRTRVTPAVVAGSALTVGPGTRLTAGYSYSWFDQKGTADTAYYLEAIDLNGRRQWTGPIYPYGGASNVNSPQRQRALLLSELASSSTAVSTASGRDAESAWPATMKAEARTEAMKDTPQALTINPAGLAVQQAIAAGKAVKIQVRQSGWYRLSQAELVAAGFDPSADARLLQLYVDGAEVPIELSSTGTRFNANDTLEFYGVALDTPTTDTRTYWLITGNSAGKRITGKSGKVKAGYQNRTDRATAGSFLYTVERSEKLIYSSHLLNCDADNIFGAPVLSEPVTQTLPVTNLDRESSSQAQLEVALQGLTAQGHEVQVQINGSELGTVTFSGAEHPVAKFNFNRALLHDGDNEVSLVARNGDSDISFIDSIRLTYAHQYRADNNALGFSVPGGRTVRVTGFSSPNVRVINVTNPNLPLEVAPTAEPSQGGYAVMVPSPGSETRTFVAFTDDLSRRPASLAANSPSSWNASTNGADMVIITHRDFRQAIEPLANVRRSQGLSVAVVDVEDVYDEFSYGAHTPVALRSFLSWAAGNWSRKPEYLLLVGDSSWDPRNYLNQGANDFVPTKLIDTSYMETGSDDWLADFNGTGLASMAIGRLPGRTVAEVNLMVSKIMSYEQERELNVPLRGAVMVSDNGFENQSSQTRTLLPASVAVQTINRAEVGNDDLMRGQIVNALNQGPMIVNYYGHGSVGVWTGAGLLDVDSAASLTNTNRLSLYVMMTCLNGYAHDAYVDSLGESALKAPNGGAVAVWASSGFTDAQPQFVMDTEFYRLLFGGQPLRLGEATRNAKAAISDQDVRRTWTLLGDPAMRMR